MIVLLNGQFVPEEQARISVFDRGFLYGDSLFEAVRVAQGRLFRWREHWERFDRGTQLLKIPPVYSSKQLAQFADDLIRRNDATKAVLRIQLSRGSGARGYSPKSSHSPTLLMSVHPTQDTSPAKWKVIASSFRTNPHDQLSRVKTGNKLPQVLAKAEGDERGADEALLLSPDGLVAEGTSSNIFWVEDGVVCTPPLNLGILPGITRAIVLELCSKFGIATRECSCTPEMLTQKRGLFLTLTSRGIVEVQQFEGADIQPVAIVETLAKWYKDLLRAG